MENKFGGKAGDQMVNVQHCRQRSYLTVGEICSLEMNCKNKENRMKVGSGSTGVITKGMNPMEGEWGVRNWDRAGCMQCLLTSCA